MRTTRLVAWMTMTLTIAIGCYGRHDHAYRDGGVVCSQAIDDVSGAVKWDLVERDMRAATLRPGVLAYHAHIPGQTVTRETLEHLLALAEAHDLPTLTFRELAAAREPVAAIALAFDDNTPAAWDSVADIIERHHAHVTLFITRWGGMSAADHAIIHRLADSGYDVEPHSADHLRAGDYARAHGVAAYLRDEVEPSVAALRNDGFAPGVAYAYPGGDHTHELDEVLLEQFALVRGTLVNCP
jgi:hypothetical protein